MDKKKECQSSILGLRPNKKKTTIRIDRKEREEEKQKAETEQLTKLSWVALGNFCVIL